LHQQVALYLSHGISLFALSEAETREALQQCKKFKSVVNDHEIDIDKQEIIDHYERLCIYYPNCKNVQPTARDGCTRQKMII
jgi:hypothetical protein